MHIELLSVFSLANLAITAGIAVSGSRPVALSVPVWPSLVAAPPGPQMRTVATSRGRLTRLRAKDLVAGSEQFVLSRDTDAALAACFGCENSTKNPATYLGTKSRGRLAVSAGSEHGVASLAAPNGKPAREALALPATKTPATGMTSPGTKLSTALAALFNRALPGVTTLHAAVTRAQSRGTIKSLTAPNTLDVFPRWHFASLYISRDTYNQKSATTRRQGYTPSLFEGVA